MESDDQNVESHLPVPERRRKIFEQTNAKYAAAGIFLNDPDYLALIEKWIDGEITMPVAAARWDQVRKERKRPPAESTIELEDIDVERLPSMTQEELLAEIARLAE
jgi:hypothetical protein